MALFDATQKDGIGTSAQFSTPAARLIFGVKPTSRHAKATKPATASAVEAALRFPAI
jgi:hypothetical protein